jgi:hypothetical protein
MSSLPADSTCVTFSHGSLSVLPSGPLNAAPSLPPPCPCMATCPCNQQPRRCQSGDSGVTLGNRALMALSSSRFGTRAQKKLPASQPAQNCHIKAPEELPALWQGSLAYRQPCRLSMEAPPPLPLKHTCAVAWAMRRWISLSSESGIWRGRF